MLESAKKMVISCEPSKIPYGLEWLVVTNTDKPLAFELANERANAAAKPESPSSMSYATPCQSCKAFALIAASMLAKAVSDQRPAALPPPNDKYLAPGNLSVTLAQSRNASLTVTNPL